MKYVFFVEGKINLFTSVFLCKLLNIRQMIEICIDMEGEGCTKHIAFISKFNFIEHKQVQKLLFPELVKSPKARSFSQNKEKK